MARSSASTSSTCPATCCTATSRVLDVARGRRRRRRLRRSDLRPSRGRRRRAERHAGALRRADRRRPGGQAAPRRHRHAAHPDDDRLSGIYGTILFDDLGATDDGASAPAQRHRLRRRRGRPLALRLGNPARVALLAATGALADRRQLIHESIVGNRLPGPRRPAGSSGRPTGRRPGGQRHGLPHRTARVRARPRRPAGRGVRVALKRPAGGRLRESRRSGTGRSVRGQVRIGRPDSSGWRTVRACHGRPPRRTRSRSVRRPCRRS